ncbi:hypothetical protein DLREEDagrD3_23500 [Denitratisoma sp. agr-D3]
MPPAAPASSAAELTLLLPGLLWPEPALSDTVFDLPLPALQTLLGRSRRQRQALEENAWWTRLAGQPLAAAPLRLHAFDVAPGEGPWLCADPVHLRFEQQTLVLADPAEIQLSPSESTALAATLTPLLESFGVLHVTAPSQWHLQPNEALPPCPPLLGDLIGQAAQALLPEGSEHRPWRRLFNEVQMALHGHPVNQAREAAGKPVINSLALWGGGTMPVAGAPGAPFQRLIGDDAVWRGLARHWRIDIADLPVDYRPLPGSTLAYVPALLAPTRQRNALTWREGLKALEQHWFAPILQALDRGALQAFTLVGFGDDQAQSHCLTATTRRWDRLKFWRRPCPLSELHP